MNLQLVLSCFVTAAMFCACATNSRRSGASPTRALMLQIRGGTAPTSVQAAKAQAAISDAVARAGLAFAESPHQTDYLLTAIFTPDSIDDSRGHLAIQRIEPNPGLRTRKDDDLFRDERQKLWELQRWAESRSAPMVP